MAKNNQEIPIEQVGGSRRHSKPKTEILPLSEQALEYLTKKRGLSKSTIDAYRLGCSKKGEIVIPFYDEKDELALIKFRHAEGGMLHWKTQDKEGNWTDDSGKSRIEPGGKGILLGSHLCDPAEGPLVICFGDYDAMAVSQDGVPNCVGMPFGDGGHQFVKYQWTFLDSFSEIVLYPDCDKYPTPEAEMNAKKKLEELASRLGKHRVRLVSAEHRHGTKDANELLLKGIRDANKEAVINADWFPSGVVAVADYMDEPVQSGTPIGLPEVDRVINGAAPGKLILIAGDNSAGKTSNALNFVANFIEERDPAFIWSGEQSVGEIRYWFERIVAGPGFLKRVVNEKTQFEYFFPLDDVKDVIRDWYRDYFFQLTEVGIDPEEFFKAAELAVRRYGCKHIIVDNLMAFTGGEGEGYYQAQGDFAQMCKEFAEKWQVSFILIVHNKKEEDFVKGKVKLPDKNSIEGSKKIQNWADILLQVYRVPNTAEYREQLENADTIIKICKSRQKSVHFGVALTYHDESNRLCQKSESDKIHRNFSWIKQSQYNPGGIPKSEPNYFG